MSRALLRRRGVVRVTGVLAASAVASVGVIASTTAASAEESIPATLKTFAAEAFANQADELPSGLVEAIKSDLGISPAEYLADAAAAKVAADVVTSLQSDGVSVDAAVFNPEDQSLGIHVTAEADIAAVEAVGAIVLGEKPAEGEYPEEIEAYEDLKGGYGYADNDGRCSVGFNGYAADGSPVVATAGHCNPDNDDREWRHFDVDAPVNPKSNPAWPLGEVIGQGGEFEFAAEHDAGQFAVTNDGWTPRPVVSSWGNGEGNPREGEIVVTDHADPIIGAPVCRSGASTGYQCGTILETDYSISVDGTPVTGFITDACAAGGDSGGAFLTGTAAVGTLTGGTGPDSADCDDWDTVEHFTLGYAMSGSEYSHEAFYGDGWELSVAVSTPTVTAPADGSETGPSVTFTGTVENASTHHRVTVSVDGGDAVEGVVNADGSFSVPLEGELEPGEHTYAVQAFYGNHSQSEVAEGSFTSAEAAPVEQLTVESPSNGQTTGDARPPFNGTGQPGAAVSLAVGGDGLGDAEVAEDGTWTITPRADLPVGERFDATVTQTFENDTQEVTVSDLGIHAPDVTITAPEDGSTVAGDVVFEGTSFPDATIGLLLEPAGAEGAAPNAGTQLSAMDEGDEPIVWEGDFAIDEEGNWTFTPAEALEDGEYTVAATATLEGGDPKLSDSEASVSFTVSNGGGDESGDAGGAEDGDDLPDTGSSNTWMIFLGVGLLAAGGAAVAIRARRNSTTA